MQCRDKRGLGMLLGVSMLSSQAFAGDVRIEEWFIPSPDLKPEGVWVSDLVGLEDEEDSSRAARMAGSLKVKPRVDVAVAYDDNVYRSSTNSTSDMVTIVAPEVRLESDWERHALYAETGGEFVRHLDNSSEDRGDWYIGMGGTVEAGLETDVTAYLKTAKLHEDRASVENPGSGFPIVTYNEDLMGLQTAYDGGPGMTVATVERRALDFHDGNDDRDRDELRLEARIGYALSDTTEAFIQPAWQRYDFDNAQDQFGVNRDADVIEFLGGARYQLSGLSLLDISAGVMRYGNDDSTLQDETAFALRAAMEWRPVEELEVISAFTREIGTTNIQSTASILRNRFEVLARQAYNDYVSLRGEALYEQAEFNGTTREDDNWGLGMGVEYYLSPEQRLALLYRYRERDSSVSTASFDNNIFMLQLGLAK